MVRRSTGRVIIVVIIDITLIKTITAITIITDIVDIADIAIITAIADIAVITVIKDINIIMITKKQNNHLRVVSRYCFASFRARQRSFASFRAPSQREGGFTLIELLIAIGVIVILSTILIISISPGQQMQKARDKQREGHISAVYLALIEYKSKEGGFPSCVTTTASDVKNCENDLVSEYLAELPEDPSSGCEYDTGYFVKKDDTIDRIGVKAMCVEGEEEITVGNW